MAEDILQFQDGREARINGKKRDGRRSPDWLEGWDQVHRESGLSAKHIITRDAHSDPTLPEDE